MPSRARAKADAKADAKAKADAAARIHAEPGAAARESLPVDPPAATPAERQAPAVPPTLPCKDLQAFPNPAPERDYVIRFDVPEFTCLCPLTGQPDFAHFAIAIVADALCVELKSLKLYLWSFRNTGAFHEKVTNTIADDIVAAIQPRFLRIHADWYVRGGIRTFVTVEHRKKGWKPAARVELPAA